MSTNSRIVISDVHGCIKTLKALIAKLPAGVPITIAGDLIDRGPDSRGVIDFVRSQGYDCVIGNHEVMMLDECKFKTNTLGEELVSVDRYHGIWNMNGGDITLDSYLTEATKTSGTRVHEIKALKKDLKWLKTLPYYLEYPNLKNKNGDHLLVTHTTPERVWGELSEDNPQFKSALIWDRHPFPPKIEGIYSVYGHTPQKGVATVQHHFACVDTGVYVKREPYGKLTAFEFPSETLYEQKNIED